MERLRFSDKGLAFDLDGAAGQVARTLGAVFGPESITNKEYVGIGLSLLDVGLLENGTHTTASLAALAADPPINAANVDLVGLSQTGLAYLPS